MYFYSGLIAIGILVCGWGNKSPLVDVLVRLSEAYLVGWAIILLPYFLVYFFPETMTAVNVWVRTHAN